jgi:CTP:phosphocholine cytidylyltransferase-like protein
MNQVKHNYLTKNIFHFDDKESSYIEVKASQERRTI